MWEPPPALILRRSWVNGIRTSPLPDAVRYVAVCSSHWLLCRAAVVPFSQQPCVTCRASWNPVLALCLLSGMGSAAVCVFFLGMSCSLMFAGWLKVSVFTCMFRTCQSSLKILCISIIFPASYWVFLFGSIKAAVHQFLIGTRLINEQLRGAVLQLQLPDTNIASLCRGIQLSC